AISFIPHAVPKDLFTSRKPPKTNPEESLPVWLYNSFSRSCTRRVIGILRGILLLALMARMLIRRFSKSISSRQASESNVSFPRGVLIFIISLSKPLAESSHLIVAGQINCCMRQELWLQQSSGQKSFIFDRKWPLDSELIRLFVFDCD